MKRTRLVLAAIGAASFILAAPPAAQAGQVHVDVRIGVPPVVHHHPRVSQHPVIVYHPHVYYRPHDQHQHHYARHHRPHDFHHGAHRGHVRAYATPRVYGRVEHRGAHRRYR